MAATERVVVLMTPEQKAAVADRAGAEALSLSDYMRRRALGDDEALEALLTELEVSTSQALDALDRTLERSREREAATAEREAAARRRALDEFKDVDPRAFGRLLYAEAAR
jgi:hypothetical protein